MCAYVYLRMWVHMSQGKACTYMIIKIVIWILVYVTGEILFMQIHASMKIYWLWISAHKKEKQRHTSSKMQEEASREITEYIKLNERLWP